MGLFKNIGRKVEEFKKTSEAVAAEEAEYECAECGNRLLHAPRRMSRLRRGRGCAGTESGNGNGPTTEDEPESAAEETNGSSTEYEAEPFEKEDDEAESVVGDERESTANDEVDSTTDDETESAIDK